jgi:hypothetical protein
MNEVNCAIEIAVMVGGNIGNEIRGVVLIDDSRSDLYSGHRTSSLITL